MNDSRPPTEAKAWAVVLTVMGILVASALAWAFTTINSLEHALGVQQVEQKHQKERIAELVDFKAYGGRFSSDDADKIVLRLDRLEGEITNIRIVIARMPEGLQIRILKNEEEVARLKRKIDHMGRDE